MTDLVVGIVTYHPDLTALKTMIASIDPSVTVLVCDNSDNAEDLQVIHAEEWRSGGSVVILGASGNAGTAWGINTLAMNAAAVGASWLLYFDQDTLPDPDYVERAERAARAAPPSIAVLAAGQINGTVLGPRRRRPQTAIASGMTIRLSAWSEVGGFDECLFLDTVDHEFCLRIDRQGLAVRRLPELGLSHVVGSNQFAMPTGRILSAHVRFRRILMWRNTAILTRRNWTTDTGFVARQVAGLLLDSVACAVRYRQWYFLSSVLVGSWQGLRTPAGRRRWADLQTTNHPVTYRRRGDHVEMIPANEVSSATGS